MSRQPSTVQFSAATYTATEAPGSSTAHVTVSRAGVGTITVDWAMTTAATATAGSDYTAASGTLTFTGTETTKQFDVTILDDALLEGQETIGLVLRNPTGGAMIGPRRTATILVNDDDQSVEFAAPGITVSEATTTVTLTLKRNGPPITAFTAQVVLEVGGTPDLDYPGSIVGSVLMASFAVGQVTKTITFPLLNDTVIDGDKKLFFRILTPSAPNVLLGNQTIFTVTVKDNDTPGAVRFAVPASTVVEGGLAKLTVLRSGVNLAGGIVVGYQVEAGSTATPDVDYKLLGTGTLTFAAGQVTQTISVQTIDDTIAEPPETVIIRLIGLGNPGVNVPSVPPITDIHTLTIKDNDVPGVLRFTVADLKVKEGDSGTTPATLTVTRGAGASLGSGVTVDFATGGSAENGRDYTLANGTLSFGADEASKTITIPINGDLVGQGDRTIEVTLSNPTGRATLGSPSVAKITIVDNEAAVYFPGERVIRVSEATPSVTVTVARSGPATIPFTVPINVLPFDSNGVPPAARPGVDYIAPPNNRIDVVFPSGVVTRTVSIQLLDNRIVDGERQLALTPGPPSDPRVAIGVQLRKQIVITNNDTAGVIGFALPSTTLLEGEIKQVVVTRTGTNLAGGVTVNYAFVTNPAPDATPLSDFRLPGSGVLTFNAGATTASTTIEVRALTDALKEPLESFVLKLSAPTLGGTLAPGKDTHVVKIVDANQSGVIQWELAAVTTNEDAGPIQLKIKRTGVNLAQDVAVSYAIDGVPGTATPGSDYAFPAGSVTFGAGETEKTVTFSPVNDSLVEPTETVRITLSAPTNGATLGAIKTVTVSIAEGGERFTGRWALSLSGVVGGVARTGTGEFASIGGTIQVTRLCVASTCDGPTSARGGSVDFTGAGHFGVAPTFAAAGCSFAGAFTGASTGAATARGTFECPGAGGARLADGTWTATRTSTTPPQPTP
jgi:hypothetical protein